MNPAFDWGERLPTLTSERLSLRWLRDEDSADVHAVFSDPQVMRYWSTPPLPDLAAASALIREIQQMFRSRTLFQWGTALRSTDQVIGTCTLFHLDRAHRRAEIGFALARSHWRKGFATEAVERMIEFAFDTLDLHRLEADVDPRNETSLRLLERQGFQREGYLRERYHLNGELPDAVFLGLLRREWKVRQTPRP